MQQATEPSGQCCSFAGWIHVLQGMRMRPLAIVPYDEMPVRAPVSKSERLLPQNNAFQCATPYLAWWIIEFKNHTYYFSFHPPGTVIPNNSKDHQTSNSNRQPNEIKLPFLLL